MATDIVRILNNLTHFYSFAGKSVIHVGAGGGQLIGYARDVRRVIAIDSDLSAVERLRSAAASLRLDERVTIVHGEFGPEVDAADVVLFEFCLHEMAEPQTALQIAQSLAPDVVVLDHDPESDWAWHTAETEKARQSWTAVEKRRIRADQRFFAAQHFSTRDELVQRVSMLGEPAVGRAQSLEAQPPIEIEMRYRMVLL